MPSPTTLPDSLNQTLISDVRERSDRLMNYFLTGYFIIGLVLAVFYETWLIAFGIGGLCLLAYYSTKLLLPESDLYQYVLSVVLGIFMAQYIYQMHGLFEMHFFAFIGSALLITYQKWKLQIPVTVVVLVHHAVFGYLQNTGLREIYFTQLDYFALQTFIIHILLAAVIFFICGLWAYQLKKIQQYLFAPDDTNGRIAKGSPAYTGTRRFRKEV
jgi:two-component system sensor histidine kinase/response regulator